MPPEPPFKVAALIHRREDLSFNAFVRYWQDRHADVIVDNVPGLRRYVQNPRLPADPPSGLWPYDGMAELWFDDLETFKAQLAVAGETIREDEDQFIAARPVWFPCGEDIIREVSPATSGELAQMAKVVAVVRRADDVSFDEFVRYWREDSPDLLLKDLPEARRYVQSTRVPAGRPDGWPYDGMAELWFDDLLSRQPQIELVADRLRRDEAQLIGTLDWYPAQEHPVLGDRLPSGV
jgi:uncharacterized protein (TIGR02118 family)